MEWIIAFMTVALLAGLATMMASTALRSRILGDNPVLNGLVPLTAAGLVWVASFLGSVARVALSDSIVPSESLDVFVDEVAFGFPSIGDYKSHSLKSSEVQNLLAPFDEYPDQQLRLVSKEIQEINEIAEKSGMLNRIPPATVVNLSDLDAFLGDAVFFYYEYKNEWSRLPLDWAERVRSGVERGDSLEQTLEALVEILHGYQRSAGFLQGVVGMATRGVVSLERTGACMPDKVDWIQFGVVSAGDSQLGRAPRLGVMFRRFSEVLVSADAIEPRLRMAERLASLFEMGCMESLARIFTDAAKVFEEEAGLMERYVERIEELLKDRKSNKMLVRLTISNVGRHDSFVRKAIKLAIGPRSGSEKEIIEALAAAREQDLEGEGGGSYFSVKSRSARTVTFVADLKEATRDRLYGTYVGGLNYLRAGVSASAGKYEGQFLSSLTPFSKEAISSAEQQVAAMMVSLDQ